MKTHPVITSRKVEDLIPYARNSRTHSDEQVAQTVAAYAEGGYVHGAAQDEALATWEPSIDRPPAYRPDLVMLGLSRPHPWYEAECA